MSNTKNDFLKTLIGKTEKEAQEMCKKEKYSFRTVRMDKTTYVGTQDLNFDRVNLELDNGLVTKCDFG